VDSADFNLPEAIEEEIAGHGFWAFGGGGRFAIDTGPDPKTSLLALHPPPEHPAAQLGTRTVTRRAQSRCQSPKH
jgi:hypothetical protein